MTLVNQFRVGIWPNYFDGVQFSRDPETLNQYFRFMTPNTGPFDMNVVSDGVAALFKKVGPASSSPIRRAAGRAGSLPSKAKTSRRSSPSSPAAASYSPNTVQGAAVPLSQFMALTRIPILVIYGDNIPDHPMDLPAQDSWRARLRMARLWRDTVNKYGGNVIVVRPPDIFIRGNTHFAFSDLNNAQIADLVSKFLDEKGLSDRR